MLRAPHIGSHPEWRRDINPLLSDRRTLPINYRGSPHLGAFVIDDAITTVIEPQSFVRDCMVRSLQTAGLRGVVNGFPDVSSYLEQLPDGQLASVVLLSALHTTRQAFEQDLERLRTYCHDAAKIVIFEHVDGPLNQYAIQNGLRGVFPADLPLDVAIEALNWIRAGGVYVPADAAEQHQNCQPLEALFTSKQIKVIEGLKRGKSNKTIAYELNICESTVKVHVRAIMRKLDCRSRTEVVFKVGELLEQKSGTTANSVERPSSGLGLSTAVPNQGKSFEAAAPVNARSTSTNADARGGFFTAL